MQYRRRQIATLCTLVGVGLPGVGVCASGDHAGDGKAVRLPESERCIDRAAAQVLALEGYVFICRNAVASAPAAAPIRNDHDADVGPEAPAAALVETAEEPPDRSFAVATEPEPDPDPAEAPAAPDLGSHSDADHSPASVSRYAPDNVLGVELFEFVVGDPAATADEAGRVDTAAAAAGDETLAGPHESQPAAPPGDAVRLQAAGPLAEDLRELPADAMPDAPELPAASMPSPVAGTASPEAVVDYTVPENLWQIDLPAAAEDPVQVASPVAPQMPDATEAADEILHDDRMANAGADTSAIGVDDRPRFAASDEKSEWVMVGDASLERARGGFDLGGGLVVSFGISRAVTINGSLVTTTSFSIPDVARITAEQARAVASTLGAGTLVQNGLGNQVDGAAHLLSAGTTVIQNTLNNQTIRNITTIDAAVNSAGILRNLNVQSTLRDAVTHAVPFR